MVPVRMLQSVAHTCIVLTVPVRACSALCNDGKARTMNLGEPWDDQGTNNEVAQTAKVEIVVGQAWWASLHPGLSAQSARTDESSPRQSSRTASVIAADLACAKHSILRCAMGSTEVTSRECSDPFVLRSDELGMLCGALPRVHELSKHLLRSHSVMCTSSAP